MNKSKMVRDITEVLDDTVKFKYDYKRNRFVLILNVYYIKDKDTYNRWSIKVLKRVHKLVRVVNKFDLEYVGSNWNWINFYGRQSVKLYFKPIKIRKEDK